MSSTGSKMAGGKVDQASVAGSADKSGVAVSGAWAVQVVMVEAAATTGAATGGERQDPAMIPFIYRGTQMMVRKTYKYRMLQLFSRTLAILIAMVAPGFFIA